MKKLIMLGLLLGVTSTASVSASPNNPVRYPDNSYRYAYGFSGIDFPNVYVQRGHVCNIVLDQGEQLSRSGKSGVILDDRVRWAAVVQSSGGQELLNGRLVPLTWSVSVMPDRDAEDAWLTINTRLGNRYMVHLIPVDRYDARGEHIVGFYHYHRSQAQSKRPVTSSSSGQRPGVRLPTASGTQQPTHHHHHHHHHARKDSDLE